MIDLRSDSTTFGQWVAAELTAENYRMLYIPQGFAHGFQTLTDAAELTYLIWGEYCPEAEAGVRWNDPYFGIEWPLHVTVISPRDGDYADF
jgi:dTDP-4-dehydrorhamnose 3,5-epimerase